MGLNKVLLLLLLLLVKPIHFAYKKANLLIIYLLLFKVNVNDYKLSQNITGCITLSRLNCVERMRQLNKVLKVLKSGK